MTRPTPRRPSSSRAVTPRPRRIAGGPPATDAPPSAEEPATEPDSPEEPPPPGDWPVEDAEDGEGSGSALSSPRVTRMLLVLVGLLALVLLLQAGWWLRHSTRDEPKASGQTQGAIQVPAGRPVLPNELAVQEGVEAAAKAAETIINRTFKNYDQEVEKATDLMTDDFAEEYVQTTDDVREQFIARRTTVQARVVGQGVVRANDTELQALLFIDQFVIRKENKETKTSRTPYRALVTVVNTEDGWLVDDVQTE